MLEVRALAARLDTSPAMVQAMLEHLQRQGIIQPFGDACAESCRGCSLSQACHLSRGAEHIRLWNLS
jgi:hypothetical protein